MFSSEIQRKEDAMKGFYFGGTMIDRTYLRAAVLYYDFILHYDVEKFFKPFSNEWPLEEYIDEFYSDTKIFRNERLLRFIPIAAWVEKYGDVFSSLIKDNFAISDPELDKLTNITENRRLIYFHDFVKFPSSMWPIYEKRMKEVTIEKAGIEPGYSERAISRLRSNEPGYFTEARLNEAFAENIKIAAGRETVYGLIGSIEFNAVPFTDMSIYTQYFNYLLLKLANNEQLADEYYRHVDQIKVVTEALKIGVPAFDNLPDEELLKFRDQRKSELDAFRQAINDLTEEVQTLEIADNVEKHLKTVIRSRVNPKIADLKEVVDEKAIELKKKRIENIAIATVNLIAFTYLPFETLVLPSILALAKFTTDEIGMLLERQKYKKNGLYILWDLQKVSNKTYS